ncbi:MAG: glycoside hydrolase family 5 protein, partial [Syntrophothermus sp.]
MKKTLRNVGMVVLGLLGACILLSIVLSLSGGHFSVTLPVKHRSEFTGGNISQYPGRLEAHGSQLVDANGEAVLLKGLMPPGPARLRSDGDFGQKLIAEMAGTGANVIRIPVHPENWVRDPDYLWRYLDPIVAWAGEADLYVIVDWHYIGNVATGAGQQMPDLEEKPMDLTLAFWRSTARYFRETPNVIFEIFNEPQSIAAAEWHSSATAIVRAIREQGADQLVIVGGLEYGKDLS